MQHIDASPQFRLAPLWRRLCAGVIDFLMVTLATALASALFHGTRTGWLAFPLSDLLAGTTVIEDKR